MAERAAWVAFVNAEAEELLAKLGTLPRDVLRGHMRDRLAEAFPPGHEVELRCLVVGARPQEGPAAGAQVTLQRGGARLLELVPEGLTRDAAGLTGPLLAATTRPLEEGSVVRVRLALRDPRAREGGVPGLAGDVLAFDVEVAVEP